MAMREDKQGVLSEVEKKAAMDWKSAFTGITVVSNRTTLAHRDQGGAFHDFDFLVSTGTHKRAELIVQDLGASYSYQPGAAVAICGRLLQHKVEKSFAGERVCYAHFTRDKVLGRHATTQRSWVMEADFI